MKRSFLTLATIALSVISCNENSTDATLPDDTQKPVEERITEQISVDATMPGTYSSADGTRAVIDAASGKTSWETSDMFGIKTKSDATTIVDCLSTTDGDIFSGEIAAPQYGQIDEYLYAAYPKECLLSDGTATTAVFEIPANQTGEFPTPIMIASTCLESCISSEDISLHFKHANAILMVTTDQIVDRIEIETLGGEKIAGTYTYDFATDCYTLSGASDKITVVPNSTTAYISIPAVSLSGGICLTLTKGSQTMVQSYSNVTELKSGGFYTIPDVVFTPIAVGLDIKTSYSEKANEGDYSDGSTIYLGNTATITGINSKMLSSVSLKYRGQNISGTTQEGPIESSREGGGKSITLTQTAKTLGFENRGSYDILADITTVTGQTYQVTVGHAILTGLPYEADWRSNDYNNWTYITLYDNGSCVKIDKSKTGGLISPDFYIKDDINVKTAIAVSSYNMSSSSRLVYIKTGNKGSSTTTSGTNISYSRTVLDKEYSDTEYTACNTDFTLQSDNPCLVYTAVTASTRPAYIYRIKIYYTE